MFEFTLFVLAVYRVSYMVTTEDGPFDMFSRLRERVGQSTWIGRGLNCVLCASFWLSMLPALTLAQTVIQYALYWFAIAGAVLLIHKYLTKR